MDYIESLILYEKYYTLGAQMPNSVLKKVKVVEMIQP